MGTASGMDVVYQTLSVPLACEANNPMINDKSEKVKEKEQANE